MSPKTSRKICRKAIPSDDAVQIFLDGYDGTGKAVERRNAFGQTRSAVLYEDAFGPGVDYYCYPTPFGVNTEIVVDKPGGAGTFQIRMRLPRPVPPMSLLRIARELSPGA